MGRINKAQIGRMSAAAAVSLALIFSLGCSRDPNVRKQKYLESGKRYEASGKYREAAIQYQNALRLDKNFADAHFELAKALLKLNDPIPAYLELMRTVDLAPGNLTARAELGDLLLAGNELPRAEDQAKAILAANPNNADAYALMAGIDEKKGNSTAAMADIQRALAIEPNRAAFHTSAGLLATTSPETQGSAEGELRKAISLDAKNPIPYLVLAGILDRKGDHQGAEGQYTAAIGAAPKDLQARVGLAQLYLREGNKDKAEQTLHQAVDDLPDNEPASTLLLEYYGRTGQLDRAETVFADLTSKHAKSLPIKINYARVLADRKEFDKATKVGNELTKSDGGNPEVQALNALLLMNSGKVNDAFALLQKATKDSPKNLQLQLLLARVAQVKGDAVMSEASYRAAEKISPGNMDAATGLAAIAMGQNALQKTDAQALTEIAEQTIKLHPEMTQGYMWRGTAEASRKEFDKAEADFQTVVKRSPDDSSAYLELALLRIVQGHDADAKTMLEKSLEKNPDAIRALALLIGYDLRAKQPEKALARIQAQITKSPKDGALYSELSYVQAEMKDYKGALESAKKGMELNPGDSNAAQIYTRAELELGQVDPAIATWEQWVVKHPLDTQAFSILGSLEDAKGDQAKAIDYYKKALAVDPNNPTASNNLAYLMVDNNQSNQNVDVALTLAQTARRLNPTKPETADTLAWVYYYKGDYSSARSLLEDAVKAQPDSASMQYHLGMTYSKINDKTAALLHLKKAEALAPNTKTALDAKAELTRLGAA